MNLVPPTPKLREDTTTRYALLIGNTHYEHSDRLPKCANDVDLLESTLSSKLPARDRFKVRALKDLSSDEMWKGITSFFADVQRFQEMERAVVLFFFCGHGFYEGDTTYLVPTNDDINQRKNWVTLRYVVETLRELSNVAIAFLLMDCCRANPLGEESRQCVDVANNVMIVTACGSNRPAYETGEPFSQFLSFPSHFC